MNRMVRAALAVLALAFAHVGFAAHDEHDHGTVLSAPSALSATFEKLKLLEGEWIDVDGVFGPKGAVVVVYRVTAGGSALIETHFPGKKFEMTTLIHKDGSDLVLTHYCSVGNQPRMRAKFADGNRIVFEFDGGTNFDASKDRHMHRREMELVSLNEISGEWDEWLDGHPEPRFHKRFRLVRKTA